MGGFSGGNSGANDTDVSGAEAVATGGSTYSDKKRKGYQSADYNPEKDDSEAKLDMFYEQGATNIKNTAKTPALAVMTGPLQAGSRKNREFFTDKVLGSKNFADTTKEDFMNLSATKQEEMYQDYMTGRQEGRTDAYGNEISQSTLGRREQKKTAKSLEQPKTDSQMNAVKPDETPAGPTTTEMADADTILTRNKKKGRRSTIMTDPLGVDEEVTLSKKKLLG